MILLRYDYNQHTTHRQAVGKAKKKVYSDEINFWLGMALKY
jgi:hypothetical protein